ncbi:MAG: LacI family DNA-binding transcriptional regulator [Wenzhouxiangella sp.]|nr:MAG: LacI family DNA-binding transcriptional regulator [Wenzhouxiangella sp.]
MSKSTINDVARLAGVSIKTVSRVVNRESGVRDATREKVEKAIAELNYWPNQSARDLAASRAHLICLVYDDPSAYKLPSSGYIIRLQEGVLRVCRSLGYELLIHPCNYRNDDVESELKFLIQRARPTGIVLAAPLSNIPKIVRAISATGTPLVRLSPGQKLSKEMVVATNDREFAAEMTCYLASLGHRRIGFITGHPRHKAVGHRFEGYKAGLKASGLTFSEELVAAGDNSFGSGEAAALKLLDRKSRPTAIFAANDDMAVGVLRVADRLGIRVPDELSIAGCDDITLAEQIHPALTTIRQPFAAMAEKATLMLVKGTEESEAPKGTVIVPGALKIRESTGPAPG